MKPEPEAAAKWIRGRFRGVYSAPRGKPTEGARRIPLDLSHGELSDVVPIAAPEPHGDGLHFEKVARVRIAACEGGPAEGERPLFDVTIRDCRLLHPAESSQRLYGTLVGELSARLLPEVVERPLELLRAPEPAAPQSDAVEPDAPEPPAPASEPAPLSPLRLELPEQTGELHANTTHEQDMERLLWLLVPTLLCVVGTALAAGCGAETAAIWLAPLAGAIAIRQTPTRFRIHGTLARRLFGGGCALAPIFALLAPVRANPLLLGAPVVAAALTCTQIWVWVCALIWTATLIGWYGTL